MAEATKQIKDLKALIPIQRLFARNVPALGDIDDAEKRFPLYFSQLSRFLSVDPKELESNSSFKVVTYLYKYIYL